MAFYQMLTSKDSQLDNKEKEQLKSAVYVSTGGNPSYGQMDGLIKNAPNATFHLGFDNDKAGRQFEKTFRDIASKVENRDIKIIREEPSEGYKDFNDELLGKDQHSLVDLIETAFDDESGIDLTVEELDEVEENEKEKQRKRIAEGSQLFCWNYCNDYYVKSILDDNDILRIIEEASFEKDGQENKVSNIFDKFGNSGIMIYQKLEKE